MRGVGGWGGGWGSGGEGGGWRGWLRRHPGQRRPPLPLGWRRPALEAGQGGGAAAPAPPRSPRPAHRPPAALPPPPVSQLATEAAITILRIDDLIRVEAAPEDEEEG